MRRTGATSLFDAAAVACTRARFAPRSAKTWLDDFMPSARRRVSSICGFGAFGTRPRSDAGSFAGAAAEAGCEVRRLRSGIGALRYVRSHESFRARLITPFRPRSSRSTTDSGSSPESTRTGTRSVPIGRNPLSLRLAGPDAADKAQLPPFTLLSTNGTFPNDFDMARAIAQMWKAVGINATIEETTPAKLVEAAQNGKLTGVLLYSWANSTGDPENYAGRIFDPRLRFATWKDMSLAPRIDGLMTEVDEAKRMAGYKALNAESSEKSWAIPLLQGVATVAYSSTLQPVLFDNGYVLPVEYKYR